jgi:hypothetical protein
MMSEKLKPLCIWDLRREFIMERAFISAAIERRAQAVKRLRNPIKCGHSF